MYFITTKRMLEVCFSAHPNIQYRTINNLLEQQLLFCAKNRKEGTVSSIFILGHTFCTCLQMFSDKGNFCGEIKKGNIHPINSCVLFDFILTTPYKYGKNKIYS